MRLTLTLCGLLLAGPAFALGDKTQVTCGVNAEDIKDSEVKIICGIPQEEVREWIRLSLSGRAEDYVEVLRRIDALTPDTARLTSDSIASFFSILAEDEVPPELLTEKLAEIARRHLELRDELSAFRVADPEIQALLDQAGNALAASPPDHATARTALAEARAMRTARRKAAESIFNEQRREEAAIARAQAELEASVLDRLAAARLYQEAADLLPQDDTRAIWSDLFYAAKHLYDHGDLKGDNGALVDSIGTWQRMLYLRPRAEDADDWAKTQNNLGNALSTLGERESGTNRLEEAIAAYRAALTELTRDRVPLDWATTQNNLGNALWNLGERESGTNRLEEAIAAYHAALTERTRDRVPLDWATTQNNLGNALQTLGARESGTDRLEEAVAAYRAALTERTRDRVPLNWARTQNNLGAALRTLGERESGTDRLEEAVAAYRAALTERTRDRVPLSWATTQNNLGTALQTLGARESGTDRLEEAIAAYRAALTEWTRDRVPLNWAGTRYNMSLLHLEMFQRSQDQADLDRAIAAAREAKEVFEIGAPHYLAYADRLLARLAAQQN